MANRKLWSPLAARALWKIDSCWIPWTAELFNEELIFAILCLSP